MMQSDRSAHPNAVHQLMVAVSKNYYLSKAGLLKYQKKPMDITLPKVAAAERRHMLIYTLRDHSSAVRYAEIGFGPQLSPLQGFLARAWGAKADSPFCGLPTVLTFPRTVDEAFPGVAQAVAQLGVQVAPAGSGFKSGARDPLEVERVLAFHIDKPVAQASAWLAQWWVLNSKNKFRTGNGTKIDQWRMHAPPIVLPPSDWGLD